MPPGVLRLLLYRKLYFLSTVNSICACAYVPVCVFVCMLISQVPFCCVHLFRICWHRKLAKADKRYLINKHTVGELETFSHFMPVAILQQHSAAWWTACCKKKTLSAELLSTVKLSLHGQSSAERWWEAATGLKDQSHQQKKERKALSSWGPSCAMTPGVSINTEVLHQGYNAQILFGFW